MHHNGSRMVFGGWIFERAGRERLRPVHLRGCAALKLQALVRKLQLPSEQLGPSIRAQITSIEAFPAHEVYLADLVEYSKDAFVQIATPGPRHWQEQASRPQGLL